MSIPLRILPLLAILLLPLGCSQSPAPLPTTIGGSAGEGDWPTFHGPQRDNICHETGLLTEWPSDGPELLWAAEGLGGGFATVSIADGAIYTSGNIDNQTTVTSLNLDGSLRWQSPVGQAWTGSHEGSRSTPTIDGDRVYCGSPHGEIFCLQAETGQRSGRSTSWNALEAAISPGGWPSHHSLTAAS